MPVDLSAATAPTQIVASFEERLDGLHEMLYRRGGIRPVNAAIEELTKLLLLQVVRQRDPDFSVAENLTLSQAISPEQIMARDDVELAKAAFSAVISHPDVGARVPGGGTQALWPMDEPLRITRADVLAEALDILGDAVKGSMTSDEGYDPLGTAFDVFLRGRYDHAGGLATHLTPHTVVTHLARLCLHDLDLLEDLPAGPIIGDPCCGTGRFLLGLSASCVHSWTRSSRAIRADSLASAHLEGCAKTVCLGLTNPPHRSPRLGSISCSMASLTRLSSR